jgi:hypothetical protein
MMFCAQKKRKEQMPKEMISMQEDVDNQTHAKCHSRANALVLMFIHALSAVPN